MIYIVDFLLSYTFIHVSGRIISEYLCLFITEIRCVTQL